MKVILRQNIDNLGKIGELVTVRNGYGRNYLIPRGLVYYASEKALKALEVEKKKYARRMAKEKSGAEIIASRLAEMQISIPMKVGEEGKLYGSVTSQMVASELAARGIEVDRRHITIEENIKNLGVFDVKIKLHPEVVCPMKIWVISEE